MRNRFYQTPHCTGLGTDFPGAQAHLRGMKAEGGWAVVNTEYCSDQPRGRLHRSVSPRLWDDDDVASLELMVEHGPRARGARRDRACTAAACRDPRLPSAGAQHLRTSSDEGLYSASCTRWTSTASARFRNSTSTPPMGAARSGFDIVNVHGAEAAAIPVHFLMTTTTNAATSTAARSRTAPASGWRPLSSFVRHWATTARSPPDSASTRFTAPIGIRVEEEAFGSSSSPITSSTSGTSRSAAGTWRLDEDAGPSRFTARVLPGRLHRGRAHGDQQADRRGGSLHQPRHDGRGHSLAAIDIIGAARPSIADPFLPKKIEEGRWTRSANASAATSASPGSTQAAPSSARRTRRLGEEYRRGWHPERFDRGPQRRQRRAHRRRRPGRHGVRDRARQARMRPDPPGRRGRRDRRLHCGDRGLPAPRRMGRASSTTARSQLDKPAQRRGDPEKSPQRRGRARPTGPRSSSSRPAPTGATTA